jgi:hypothetical protein
MFMKQMNPKIGNWKYTAKELRPPSMFTIARNALKHKSCYVMMRLFDTSEPPPPSEAWKRENEKYLAWFSNQHPNETAIQPNGKMDTLIDVKSEWNAMVEANKALGWNALIPTIPLLVLAIGVLYAIMH